MKMTADITTVGPGGPLARQLRLQAFLSSLVVMIGAFLAAFLALAALVVTLPLMLAASATMQPRRQGRRGWQELEPREA